MRAVTILCWSLGVLTAAWSIFAVSQGTEFLTTRVTVDDTYYYLLLALNHAKLGFPTFDGLNPTNGFHPLWHGILLVLAQVFPSKDTLLPVALILSGALAACGFGFIHSITRSGQRPEFGFVLAGLWFAYVISTGAITTGMESCTTAVCFWWSAALLVKLDIGTEVPAWLLAIPLSLLLWSRIDCAFFVLASLFYLAVMKGQPKKALLVSTIVAFTLIPYFVLMMRWNGTAIPISGLIKTGHTAATLSEFGSRLFNRLATLVFQGRVGEATTLLLFLGAAAGFLGRAKAPLEKWIVVFLVASAAYVGLLSFTHWSVAKWYFVAVDITLLLWLAKGLSVSRVAVNVSCAALILFTVYSASIRAWQPVDPQHVYAARYQAAKWIDANLPKEAILASFNSGQLGYFSGRRMINLDGFVNSTSYAETVLKGKVALIDYLGAQNVSYLVDYGLPPFASVFEHRAYVYSVPVKTKGKTSLLRIWKVSPIGSREKTPVSE